MALNPFTREVQFTDLPITFTAHPITNNVETRKNIDAVTGAIKNILLTNRYEVPYNPLFGSDILNRLFEPLDPIELVNLERDAITAIQNHEPRVRITKVNVHPRPNDRSININITGFIVNQSDPFTLNVEIERTR